MLVRVAIIAVFCAINIVNAQKKFNKYLQGTYEFEIAGRPHKLYLFDSSDKKGIKSLHWSIADITNNEYTIGMIHTLLFMHEKVYFFDVEFIGILLNITIIIMIIKNKRLEEI